MKGFPQEDTLSTVKKAGWAVKKHIEVCAVKITERMVYCQLQRKEFSSLNISMDEKIEAGLSEFDKTQMSGIALDETIDRRGECLCVKLTVPQ